MASIVNPCQRPALRLSRLCDELGTPSMRLSGRYGPASSRFDVNGVSRQNITAKEAQGAFRKTARKLGARELPTEALRRHGRRGGRVAAARSHCATTFFVAAGKGRRLGLRGSQNQPARVRRDTWHRDSWDRDCATSGHGCDQVRLEDRRVGGPHQHVAGTEVIIERRPGSPPEYQLPTRGNSGAV